MRRLLFIGVMLFASHLFAGSTDSIEAILRTEGRTTRRVDALLHMGFATYESPAGENTAYWREAQELSEELRYEFGRVHAPMEGVMADFRAQRYDAVVAQLKAMIARLDELGVDQGFYSPLGFIRNTFNASGDQAARAAYFSEALKRYAGGGRPRSLAVTHHAMAGYYSTIRQYGSAVEHYMKARDLFRTSSPADVPNETMVIGWAYERWGNPQRAIPYLHEALREFEAIGDSSMHAEILSHLAGDELSLGDTLSALRSFARSRALWPTTDSLNQAIMGSQYTQALLRMGRVREAAARPYGSTSCRWC